MKKKQSEKKLSDKLKANLSDQSSDKLSLKYIILHSLLYPVYSTIYPVFCEHTLTGKLQIRVDRILVSPCHQTNVPDLGESTSLNYTIVNHTIIHSLPSEFLIIIQHADEER